MPSSILLIFPTYTHAHMYDVELDLDCAAVRRTFPTVSWMKRPSCLPTCAEKHNWFIDPWMDGFGHCRMNESATCACNPSQRYTSLYTVPQKKYGMLVEKLLQIWLHSVLSFSCFPIFLTATRSLGFLPPVKVELLQVSVFFLNDFQRYMPSWV